MKYRTLVRQAVVTKCNVSTCAMQQAEAGEAVDAVNISNGWRRVQQLHYRKMRYEKATLSHERNPDKHSPETVGIFQNVAHMEDKYLIYKISNG